MFARGFKTWCEIVAVRQRSGLELAASDALDPLRLAHLLDVRVWRADEVAGLAPATLRVLLQEDPDSWSALTVHAADRRAVVLNPAHSAARQSSDLTHELAHLLLDHAPTRVDVSPDGLLVLSTFAGDQEQEANWLSGCLLLPREALLWGRRGGLSPEATARHYGVSLDMVRFRLNVTGVDRQFARGRRSRRDS